MREYVVHCCECDSDCKNRKLDCGVDPSEVLFVDDFDDECIGYKPYLETESKIEPSNVG